MFCLLMSDPIVVSPGVSDEPMTCQFVDVPGPAC